MKKIASLSPLGVILTSALALGLILPGCSPDQSAAPASGSASSSASAPAAGAASATAKPGAKAAAVQVETVQPQSMRVGVSVVGTVEAARIAQLSALADGPVLSIKVREGDAVKRGQVLLSLGRSEAVSSLTQSLRQDVAREQDNLTRTRRLVEIGALPAEQADIAAANVTRLQAQLTRNQESLRDYVVTAPWAGVVSKMRVREGDVASPRAPLVEMIDPTSLLVRVAVAEADAAQLRLGMPAEVALDAYPQQIIPAQISRLYPTLDPRTHTRLAELALVNSPPLLTGMFARVNIIVQTVPDALSVPSYTLLSRADGAQFVMVMQDNKAVRRPVKTALEVAGRTQVLTGLQPGDVLITAGHETLKDGAAVKVVTSNAKAKP